MTCDKCGYKNRDTAKSCFSCGTKIEPLDERKLQRILKKASDASGVLDFKVSTIDRINACISFVSIPVLLVLLILSSADIIQFIGVPLFSALSGLIALSPRFAEIMIKLRTWPFTYSSSGYSRKALRKMLSWGLLTAAVSATLFIFFER